MPEIVLEPLVPLEARDDALSGDIVDPPALPADERPHWGIVYIHRDLLHLLLPQPPPPAVVLAAGWPGPQEWVDMGGEGSRRMYLDNESWYTWRTRAGEVFMERGNDLWVRTQAAYQYRDEDTGALVEVPDGKKDGRRSYDFGYETHATKLADHNHKLVRGTKEIIQPSRSLALVNQVKPLNVGNKQASSNGQTSEAVKATEAALTAKSLATERQKDVRISTMSESEVMVKLKEAVPKDDPNMPYSEQMLALSMATVTV
ncbi:hypothetical protein HYALB_00004728 [Hymenoscyphus albidus]|uniref:Uncharacterized protein n=1 Tax=Hymenoscyphus albidus TaxID=595503 RepID=A0A9N9M2B9_9HELO|nr:hypothetical protein HYALB_00004728 [Hymenoscyphus albidus]